MLILKIVGLIALALGGVSSMYKSVVSLTGMKMQQVRIQELLDDGLYKESELCQQGPNRPEPCDCWPWPDNCC